MDRRKFLKGIAALPLVPAAVRGWAEEKAEAVEAPAEVPERMLDSILAFSEGEPLAVTVVVPPGRTIVVRGTAVMTGIYGSPAELLIYEDKTLVARQVLDKDDGMQYLDINVVLAPMPGMHTYRLAARGNLDMFRGNRPRIWVEKVGG